MSYPKRILLHNSLYEALDKELTKLSHNREDDDILSIHNITTDRANSEQIRGFNFENILYANIFNFIKMNIDVYDKNVQENYKNALLLRENLLSEINSAFSDIATKIEKINNNKNRIVTTATSRELNVVNNLYHILMKTMNMYDNEYTKDYIKNYSPKNDIPPYENSDFSLRGFKCSDKTYYGFFKDDIYNTMMYTDISEAQTYSANTSNSIKLEDYKTLDINGNIKIGDIIINIFGDNHESAMKKFAIYINKELNKILSYENLSNTKGDLFQNILDKQNEKIHTLQNTEDNYKKELSGEKELTRDEVERKKFIERNSKIDEQGFQKSVGMFAGKHGFSFKK